MAPEPLVTVPQWLVVGLGLSVLACVLVGSAFVVGIRLFPDGGPTEHRVSSEGRRRAEIREYLQAIDERYAEDHPVGDHVVAFYLPTRDVAVTFDAHAYFRLRNTDTYAVLCEHEMPGRALGGRLPFEVPEVSVDDEAAADEAVRAAFDTLDLPASADPPAVKQAYREQVKEVHPDHGGDEESFRDVREAYALATEYAQDDESDASDDAGSDVGRSPDATGQSPSATS